jgi:hypothetical protein
MLCCASPRYAPMKFVIVLVLAAAPFVAALSPSAEDNCANASQAIDVCAVLADASKYDGKTLTIRATYRAMIHGSVAFGAGCPAENINLRRAEHWQGNKAAVKTMRSLTKRNQFQEVDVVSRGIFRVARQEQCFGQDCWRYEFEEADLICAAAVKTKPPL